MRSKKSSGSSTSVTHEGERELKRAWVLAGVSEKSAARTLVKKEREG